MDGNWHYIFKNPLDSRKNPKQPDSNLNDNDSFKTLPIDREGDDYIHIVFKNRELLDEDSFGNIKS